MLHGQDLDHVQIGLCGGFGNGEDSVHHGRRQLFGQARGQLGGEGRLCDGQQEFTVDLLYDFEVVEELAKWLISKQWQRGAKKKTHLQCLVLGQFIAVDDDTGMKTLGDIPLGLLKKLTDEQHN